MHKKWYIQKEQFGLTKKKKKNKTKKSKVDALSKAQKAQNIFFQKNRKLLKFFHSENVA